MIHETKSCACDMCQWADAQEKTLYVTLPRQPDDAYFDFLWQYGPPSKLNIDKATALWWFQMGRASNE